MRPSLCLLALLVLGAPGAAPLSAQVTPLQSTEKGVAELHAVAEYGRQQVDYLRDGCCWRPTFYGSVDVILLDRELIGDPDFDFPATSLGVMGPIIARFQDLDFDPEAGVRVTLGHRFSPRCSIEGSYFGVQDFNSAFVVTDPGGRLFGVLNGFGTMQQPIFPSPPFPPTFGLGNNTTIQSGEYFSELNSFEVNLLYNVCELTLCTEAGGASCGRVALELLGGFRYFGLEEFFALRTRGNFIPPLIADPTATADYTIDAENDMYGVQIGGRLTFGLRDAVSIRLDGKVAFLANGAEQTTAASLTFGVPFPIAVTLPQKQSDIRSSILGQLGVVLQYDLTSYLSLRGGYELLWLNDRVLAPLQLDPTVARNTAVAPILNDDGTTMFYGATFGLEVRY